MGQKPTQKPDAAPDSDSILGSVGEHTLVANEIPFATSGIEAPTLYADLIRGTQISGEVAKVSLVEHRVNAQTDTVMAVHVAHIVVPTLQLRAWGTFFTRLADQLGLPASGE